MTYQEFLNKTSGTCTHVVKLQDKDGNARCGIYNGLASWGEVYGFQNGKDAYGGLFEIEQLSTDWVEDDSEDEGGYVPNFKPVDFELNGYVVI